MPEWVTFACDGTGPADESEGTKRVQVWSRLNWLGGILIIVSLHIHFYKLLKPFRSYAALPIRCKVYKIKYDRQSIAHFQNPNQPKSDIHTPFD